MKKMLAMLLIIAMLLPSLTTVLAESVEQSSVSPYLTNEETETEFIGTKTTAGEKCNVKFTPIKNTAELYGFSTYYEGGSAANWKGFVRFMSNTPEIVEFTNGYYESSFTAGDYIPSIDAIFAVKNLGASFALMRIDATTYAETEIKDYNTFYFMDMAFDRSSEVMYGVKGKTLYTIDLSNGNYTKIGNAGTPANIFTLACSDVGVLYAIDKTGSLYTLNKTSGEATLVGSTGVTLAYLQSMTWDHVNGGLYWANCNKNIGILYSLDPATAEATALGNIYGVNMEVTCLFTKGVWTGDPVPATGITVFPEEATLRTDKTLSLSAQIQPWNATEREISWTSSNPAIASVNENGFVRAITNGEATITATTVEGGFTDTCIITVPDNVQLAAEFDAAINAPGGNYHFTNDNAYPWEIVTLGERTAAKSTNAGVDGSQSFITTDPIHMYSGNTISFDWFTSCEEYYDLMFFAVNEDRIVSFSVESIDFANYVYEITAEGDYTFTWFYLKDIVGAAGEDCVYLDNVAIDAAPPGPITGVTLTPSTVDLYQTQTVQLAAALIPSSAFDIGVTFSSSNSNVATVDGSGLVTAVAPGTAFITVTTDDGGFTATSTINVTSTAELILKINAALNVGGGTLSFIMDSVNLWDTDATTFAGRNVAHSATNGKNQSSTVMTLVATTDGSKLITFDWMVSSEENYDKAVFSIDGVEKTRISGTHMTNFTTEVFNAGTAGEHTYTWVYIKDDSSGNGRDMVWLDNVTITETPAPQRVDMDVTAKVHLGQTIKVNATIVPSYATDMTLTYSTSDATKVTVDSNGFITGVGEGTATVTATAVNGVYAYCIVTVFNTIPASDGKLYGFVSSPGGITDGLTGFVSINPSTATAETIFDYSDEIFAAEYYNGVIYAFNNTTTEFLTFDAITGELLSHVSVSEVAYDMTYDYTTNTMYALFGIEDRGLATVNLATGELTHIGVMPTISPLITLAADNLGKLYGVAILTGILYEVDKSNSECTEIGDTMAGSVVYAQSMTYSYETDTLYWAGYTNAPNDAGFLYSVDRNTGVATTVFDAQIGELCGLIAFNRTSNPPEAVAVTGVSIDHMTIDLSWHGKGTLRAVIEPADATNKSLNWASENEGIVTVDDKGNIFGVSAGTANVTATTVEGGFTAICAVTVGECPYTPLEPGKAIIILSVGNVWGDGTGYQMLLDSTHSLLGTTIPTTGSLNQNGDVPKEIYDLFEYKIPEIADGALTTPNIVGNNQSLYIIVDAGIYDYCITNPVVGECMYIANSVNGSMGRGNDFVVEEGYIYDFVVELRGQNDFVTMFTDYIGTTGETTYDLGDANLDGVVNTGDAAFLLRSFIDLEVLSDAGRTVSDLNNDGEVNTGDAALLLEICIN